MQTIVKTERQKQSIPKWHASVHDAISSQLFVSTQLNLSLFRIAFCSVIFADLSSLYAWREISFTHHDLWVAEICLPLLMISLASLAAGLFTRSSAVACFILSKLVYRHTLDSYHLDIVAQAFFFVLLFAPRPLVLSIDSWRRRKASGLFAPLPIGFCLLFTVSLAVIYFDSVLSKLGSSIWLQGSVFWLSAALPHFSTGLYPKWLTSEVILKAASYCALALEMFFPLILLKCCRRWILLIGMSMHLGIAIFFPIPCFGLAMFAAYLFFVDWSIPLALLQRHKPEYRNSQTSLSSVPKSWIYLSLVLVILVSEANLRWLHLHQLHQIASIAGVYKHEIYLDEHFDIRAPILRFCELGSTKELIPTFDKKGYPEAFGRYWGLVALHLRSSQPERNQVVERYITASMHRLNREHAEIAVYAKNVFIPLKFDFSAVQKIENNPWELIANATYDRNSSPQLHWCTRTNCTEKTITGSSSMGRTRDISFSDQ